VGTLVTINGTSLGIPTAVSIGGVAAIVVSNTGTQLVGMVMPGAVTGSISLTTASGIATAAGSFTVTPTPFPSQQQGNKLVGTGNTGAASQGWSVSVSADGNTAIVGGYNDNSGQGAAWIYTRSGSSWTQQGSKLLGTGNTGAAQQGYSVAISADGNTAIVGGPTDNSNQGAAWVYTRSGSAWSQQGNKLIGTGNTGPANQGWSVSISADGNTAIVGGNFDNTGQGAAWVYKRSSSTWTQQGSKLVGTGNSGGAKQGTSVAISSDGNTAIVGGSFDNSQQGAAWIFTLSGSTWSQQGSKLVGIGNTGFASQGTSVAISANGNTAIVGGYADNNGIGAAWVFTRSGSTWSQEGNKLVGTGNTFETFQGVSVALSADGNTALVGGYKDNLFQGATWIYTRIGTTWSQQGNKLVGTGNTGVARQGLSVALSSNGNTAVIGGFGDNGNQGAAWVYTVAPTSIISFTPSSGPVGTLVAITGTSLSNPTAFTIGGVSAIVISNTGTQLVGMVMPGAVTGNISITTPIGTSSSGGNFTVSPTPFPSQQQGNKLVGTGNIGASNQGHSVAVSADGNTAVVGGFLDNLYQGAVWVYTRSGSAWSQQGNKLVGTGNTGAASQGVSLAISADGNTFIAGGYLDNSQQGAAWIFTRNGTSWSQQGNKLVGTGGSTNSRQGSSVAISADGNTAAVGGNIDNGQQGAVWVYSRNGSNWVQQGSKLVGTGNVGPALQGSVAMASDGNTLIIGGPADNGEEGAAWIFKRSGSSWIQEGTKLVGLGNIGPANQGVSVALSANGNTAILGGFRDNGNKGAAWVFIRNSGVWSQQGSKLVGSGAIGAAYQGGTVSISADGNTATIGGYFDNSQQGAAWIFTRTLSVWSQQGSKLLGIGNIGNAQQGVQIAISSNGNTAIIGGWQDNSNQGAAWVFVPCTAPTAYSVTGGGSYCSGGSGVAVGLANSEIGVNYQLQVGAANTGSPVAGTGAAISFGNQTTAGNYTVVATRGACTTTMTGSVAVVVSCREGQEENLTIEEIEIKNNTSDLLQCYPNPFSETTIISCFIQSESKTANISIYSIDGKLMQQLPINGNGSQQVTFNKGNLAAGVYFYALNVDGQQVAIKKMVISK
jgi:hypothetical protein